MLFRSDYDGTYNINEYQDHSLGEGDMIEKDNGLTEQNNKTIKILVTVEMVDDKRVKIPVITTNYQL